MLKIFNVFLFVSLVTSSLQMGFLDTIIHSKESELKTHQEKFIQSNINWSVNPCDDFYSFACGNYENNEMLSSEERQLSVENLQELFSHKALDNSLNKPIDTNTKTRKAKIFYQSCVNELQQFDKGFRNAWSFFEEKLMNATNLDWMDLSFIFWDISAQSYFINLKINDDYESFSIVQPSSALNFDFHEFADDAKLEENEKLELEEEFNKVKEFENNLIELYEYNTEVELFTLDEFIKNHTNDLVDWSRFLKKISNGNLNLTWTIQNYVNGFDNVVELVRNNTEMLVSYIKWYEIGGTYEFYNTWKNDDNACLELTRRYFLYNLTDLILNETQRNDIIEISEKLRSEFLSVIEGNEFDEQTKIALKMKLQSMKIIFEKSDEFDMDYESIELSEKFIKNVIILQKNLIANNMKGFSQNVFRPYSDRTFYYPERNILVLGSDSYSTPFCSVNFPLAIKYIVFGKNIAWKLGGNFGIEKLRMKNSTIIKSCFKDQSDDFVEKPNSEESLAIENNFELEIIYHAFLKGNQFEDGSRSFSSLNFTSNQLLFLQYAQNFCGSSSNEASDLNLTIKNNNDFGEVFQCQMGTKMNPEKKCHL